MEEVVIPEKKGKLSLVSRRNMSVNMTLSKSTISWDYESEITIFELSYVLGAKLDTNRQNFTLCIYITEFDTFREFHFACESIADSTSWVDSILQYTYSNVDCIKRIAVLVNPISGGKAGKRHFDYLFLPLVQFTPHSFTYIETTGPGFIENWAGTEDTSQFTDIITIGGDGTIHQLLSALYKRSNWEEIRKKLRFGTIPAGSRNALSCGLGGWTGCQATFSIMKGKFIECDIMKISINSQEYLATCAMTWGLISSIADEAQHYRRFGATRYTLAGIKKLFTPWQNYEADFWFTPHESYLDKGANVERFINENTVNNDQNKPYDRHMHGIFSFVCVTNHRIPDMRSPEVFTPLGCINDGAMDLITLNECGRLKVLEFLIKESNNGKHIEMDEITCLKIKKFELESSNIYSDQFKVYNIDGELYYSNKVEIEVLPRYVKLLGVLT